MMLIMTTAAVTKTFNDSFAEELRAEMARKNVSGRELARRLSENSDWISRRTSGKTPLTTVDMERIAAALESSLGTLIERALNLK